MKDIFPRIFALLFVCAFSALIFWSMMVLAKDNKTKRIEKEKTERENWHVSKPDANF